MAASTAPAAGCLYGDPGEDEAGADEEDDGPPEIPYSTFDLVDVEDDNVVAFVHVDHWHLHPIQVPREGGRSLRFRFDEELSQEHPVDEHDTYARVVALDGGTVDMESGVDSDGDADAETRRDGDTEVEEDGDGEEGIAEDDVLEEEVDNQEVIEVEGREDGVVLRGLQEGSVTVVFTLETDGELVYGSPPVEAEVS